MDINLQIANRKLFTGFCENTYYTQKLYDFWVDKYNDPDILFKIKILGYYKRRYKWTEDQCWEFINDNIEQSRSHIVDDQEFIYDWGSAENNITSDKMHKPNLDHIIPKEQGGLDIPENMRVRVSRLNENKGNTNSDIERLATIYDNINDLEDPESRKKVQDFINKMVDTSL